LAVYGALCVWGLLSGFNLPQELIPDLRFPQILVVTEFPNSNPEQVENLVTKPLEQTLGTVRNLKRLSSVSKDALSVVTVEFGWETDMDLARMNVQEKLGLIQDRLPTESHHPLVLRINPLDRPVMIAHLSGSIPLPDIHHWVSLRLQPALEKTPGVASVSVTGGMEREIQVDLDSQKLCSKHLTILDVADALKKRNVTRSAGTLTDDRHEFPVTVTGAIENVKTLGEIPIVRERDSVKSSSAEPVRLKHLGTVRDDFRELSGRARSDGQETISLLFFKRADGKPVDISTRVRRQIEEIIRPVTPRIRCRIVFDQAEEIRRSLTDVFLSVIAGGILAYGILLLFLRSHIRALIVGATIPVSLLLTFIVLHQKGLSLNLLTLGGLALGVGMLVDSAVVLMENITRHYEQNKTLERAVLDGGQEVSMPVLFSVLTTMAAFAPLPFVSTGIAQRLFTPVCLTVIISQAASLIVGATLIPALSSLFLEHADWDRFLDGIFRRGFITIFARFPATGSRVRSLGERMTRVAARVAQLHEACLSRALIHRRKWIILTALATLLNILLFIFYIPRHSMPDLDQTQLSLRITMATGTTLEATDSTVRRIEHLLSLMPEISHTSTMIGSDSGDKTRSFGDHEARIIIDLADRVTVRNGRSRRRRRARIVSDDIAERIRRLDIPGLTIGFEVQSDDLLTQAFGKTGDALLLHLQGDRQEEMMKVETSLRNDLKRIQGISLSGDSLSRSAPQIHLRMDEWRLARDGLTVSDVGETMSAALQGIVPTKYRHQGRETDIRIRLRAEDRQNILSLSQIMISDPFDDSVHPLSEYCALEMRPGPVEITRRDQERSLLLRLQLPRNQPKEARREIQRILKKYRQERGINLTLSGESDEVRESLRSIVWGLAASVILVFILLVAQFNTLRHPLLALSSIPLIFNGVVPVWLLTGQTLNLMSGEGLIILAGIVVNNSLILLEFIHTRQQAGENPEQSAREAGRLRRRPIVMTVLGNTAGLLPLLLGIGRGAEMQSPMALTVVSGLLVSTLMTLVILPALSVEFQGPPAPPPVSL